MGENTTIQQEPVYLTYGGSQIEQQPLFDALANNVQAYISEQPWSKKKKERFMSAYSDILSKGIVGANNTSGEWALDLGQVLDLDSLPKKDKEMYHEAAYYILEQMKGIPTVENKKEEDKKNLQLYTNDLHNKAIVGYIGNNLFGGQNWDYTTDWDVLDKRDEKTGILSTSGRMAKLAQVLEGYSNSLEEGKYNFEGTAFKDLNDLKTRLNAAATALRSGVMDQNVINSLNMAGINWREYLHDGSEETVTLQDGTTMTRGEYNKAKAEQEAAIAEKEASEKAAAEQQRALALKQANAGVLDLVGGIRAVEARSAAPAYAEYLAKTYGVGQQGFNNINATVQGLLEKGRNKQLTTREKKQLGNLLYYIRTNNPNYNKSNISDFEWQELNKYHNLQSKNRNGFVRLPWQTSDGRYTFADDRGNVYYLKPQNQQKLGNIKINRNNINNYRNNFLKSQNDIALNKTIGENGGLTDDMIADLTALGLDAVSAGSAFAPGYGTAVSAVTGIGATLAGAYADRARGESWGSTLGTAGFGLTMDILGLIPGVGVAGKAAKMAKVVAKGAKWIGPILGGMAALSYGPGAISAFNKFTSGKVNDISAEELRDFTYAMRAIATGGVRKAGATYQNNRTLAKAIKGKKTIGTTAKGPRASISSEKTSASITTKNGQKINLTDDEFKTLKGNGSRESKIKLLKNKGIKEEDIEWKGINPVRGRFKTSSKSSKLSGLQEGTESNKIKWSSTSADYKGIRRFSNENLLRGFTTMSAPNSGIWKSIKDRWTGRDILNSGNTKTTTPKKPYTSPSSESVTTVNSIAPLKPYEAPIKLNKDLPRNYSIAPLKSYETPIFPRNYGKVNLKEREIIESFQHSYGLGGLKTQMYKGFNGNDIKSGPVEVGPLKFTLSRTQAKEIKNNPGKIAEFRNNIAKQVQKALDQKKINNSQAAELILKLKKKGFLKQGGQLNYSMEDKITNFLKTKI